MAVQTQEAPAVRFSPRRLGHTNLFVGELARAMDFYSRVAGFQEVFRIPHNNAGFVSNGNTHHDLGLVTSSDRPRLGTDCKPLPSHGRSMQPGLNHLGWELENEKQLVEAYRRAQALGYPLHRLIDHQLSHSIYLFDPDGHQHEMYADIIQDWRSFFDSQDSRPVTGSWDPEAAEPLTEPRYTANAPLRRVDDALVHSLRITHVVFMTRDHEGMVDFFTDVAGLEPVFEAPDDGFACFAGSGAGYACDVALFRQSPGTGPAIHHHSYQVDGEAELGRAEAALIEAGIAIERKVDNAGKLSLFVMDPDELRCEFYVARKPDFGAAAAAPAEEQPFLV